MIKVQAFKESERQPQPGREDYVFEEKPKNSFVPVAFLTVLTGFAVYLKSFFWTASEAPAAQQKSRAPSTEDESMAAQRAEEGGPSIDVTPPDEPKEDAAGGSDKVVPMTARRAVAQDAVSSFLASDSPSLTFGQPKPAPAPRLDLGLAANDNQGAAKPLSSEDKNEVGKVGHGGGGGEGENVLLPRVREATEVGQEIGDVVIFSGRPLTEPVGRPPRDDGGPADRNRLPRTNGPVVLPDLIGCQAYFIPLLALLAGASDADGDQLNVTKLSATSGTVVPVEGGWMFTPDHDDVRDVVFQYGISDGTGAVHQLAHLRIVDAPPIVGTISDDNLLGTACGDAIDARDGHDNIDSRQGDDVIMAGNGNDHVGSGTGNDIIFAGAGNDVVFAGAGNDIVYGGAGNDRLFGEDGDDTIFGEQGDDFISGGAGRDVLVAGAGDDTVHGDDGDDVLDGGEGDDSLDGDDGDDVLDGGEGDDSLDGGDGRDVLEGGEGDDSLDGGDGRDVLEGGPGDDVLDGGAGDDELRAGDSGNTADDDGGDDVLQGGAGNDVMWANGGHDVLDGGPGEDVLRAGDGDDAMDGGDGNDVLYGGGGDENLQGGSGNDRVAGDAGDDRVTGEEGDDILSDGQGNDTVDGGADNDYVTAAVDAASDSYHGGAGCDTLDYSSAILDISVDVGNGYADGSEIGRDFIYGFEAIIGGQGDDHFISGSGPISMTGGGGDDTFEFKASDSGHQPDLVRKITDFTYGDRIIAAGYEIFHREEEGGEEAGAADPFTDMYLSENSDQRPIRFRFETQESGDLTFVDVHEGTDPSDFYSIELAGRHDLEFTVVVS